MSQAKPRVLAVMLCYNTEDLTRAALAKFPAERAYDVLLVDDGSIDGTPALLDAFSGATVLHHERNRGLGAAIKTGYRYAIDHGYDVIVIMAGNNKDDPAEIPRLLRPIVDEGADYVQGSRFLDGGSHANLPGARRWMVKMHAWMMWAFTGRRGTDAINGFRAYRVSLLSAPRINVWQDWLDHYELESYLHYKVLTLGHRFAEAPVSKSYPPPNRKGKYSHIRPIVDWWVIVRPLVYLRLGLKK
jgi:dolichol-phosphate mannosyltransferase